MTISTKVEVAASAKASGFHYVRSSNIAVVSVTGQRDAPNTSLRTVLQACVSCFEPFLLSSLGAVPHARILLFAATPFWDQHNALSRRRGIWGSKEWSWLPEGTRRSPSVEISGDGATRFAGLVQIGQDTVFDAADFVRTHDASFLFVSPDDNLTDQRVRSIFSKVFPKSESSVDWSSIVDRVGEGADVCIRVSGGFDDREVSIDAFISTDLLGRLRQS